MSPADMLIIQPHIRVGAASNHEGQACEAQWPAFCRAKTPTSIPPRLPAQLHVWWRPSANRASVSIGVDGKGQCRVFSEESGTARLMPTGRGKTFGAGIRGGIEEGTDLEWPPRGIETRSPVCGPSPLGRTCLKCPPTPSLPVIEMDARLVEAALRLTFLSGIANGALRRRELCNGQIQ